MLLKFETEIYSFTRAAAFTSYFYNPFTHNPELQCNIIITQTFFNANITTRQHQLKL